MRCEGDTANVPHPRTRNTLPTAVGIAPTLVPAGSLPFILEGTVLSPLSAVWAGGYHTKLQC